MSQQKKSKSFRQLDASLLTFFLQYDLLIVVVTIRVHQINEYRATPTDCDSFYLTPTEQIIRSFLCTECFGNIRHYLCLGIEHISHTDEARKI